MISLQNTVKKTILFVSHDLDEALKLGDQISIMEGGRIVQTGTAQDIVLRPANDYVAQFVAHMNPLTVLTGADVMRPAGDDDGADLPTASSATPLSDIVAICHGAGKPVRLVDNGVLKGVCGGPEILRALAGAGR